MFWLVSFGFDHCLAYSFFLNIILDWLWERLYILLGMVLFILYFWGYE